MRRSALALGTGYDRVDSDVMCVITRFQLRSTWSLLRFYWLFRSVRAQSKQVAGLITSGFLFEDLRTCYTLSIWRDERAILRFNGDVAAHVHAATGCFGDLDTVNHRKALWSAQFRLFALSPCNLQWEGVDLGGEPHPLHPTIKSA